jgi:hypothetical protein
MINPDKSTIWNLTISYYMNLKYPCNLWKFLKLLLTLQKEIKNKNVTIKQNMLWWNQMFGSWSQILYYSKI